MNLTNIAAFLSTAIALTFFIGSVIVLFLSFTYGTRDTSKWDKLLFGFAIVAYVFSCLSLVGSSDYILYVRPIFGGFVCNGALLLAILYYRKSQKKVESISPTEV